jgi:hypothetical protein
MCIIMGTKMCMDKCVLSSPNTFWMGEKWAVRKRKGKRKEKKLLPAFRTQG